MRDRDDRRLRTLAEHRVDIEWHALHPGAKCRRGQEPVELQDQLGAVLGRVEAFKLEDAELAHGWVLDLTEQCRQREIFAVLPGTVHQVR